MTRAFSSLSVGALRELGNDVVPELLRAVQERADAAETSFAAVARALPNGWRHIVMAARIVDDIDEAGSLAGAFIEIRNRRDIVGLEGFFAMLGAERLALALEEARETTPLFVDEEMDPFDIDRLREVDASTLGLPHVRQELTKRVRAMATEFPPGD